MNDTSNAPPPPHVPDAPPIDPTAGELYRTVERSRDRYRTIRFGMAVFAVIAVVFIIYLAIMDLAGKSTHADFKWEVVASWGRALSWGLVVAIAAGALGAMALWKKRVVHMGEYIKHLESKIDPNRTSSGLPPTGDTDPNDRR